MDCLMHHLLFGLTFPFWTCVCILAKIPRIPLCVAFDHLKKSFHIALPTHRQVLLLCDMISKFLGNVKFQHTKVPDVHFVQPSTQTFFIQVLSDANEVSVLVELLGEP